MFSHYITGLLIRGAFAVGLGAVSGAFAQYLFPGSSIPPQLVTFVTVFTVFAVLVAVFSIKRGGL